MVRANRIPSFVSRCGAGPAAALVLWLCATPLFAAESILIPAGSTWKFLDDGTDPGPTWHAQGFDDSAWASGPAELGYGDGDEATVVGFGPDPDHKHITTYFRPDFTFGRLGPISGLRLRIKSDDGAVVYLNGTEVFRVNMPDGPIAHDTPASSEVSGAAEDTWIETFIDPNLLPFRSFNNVLAVEIHQHTASDPDISFDAELASLSGVTRGPYLQLGTPTSTVVRWRTATPTDSRVIYGTEMANLASAVVEDAPTTEHEVALTELAPDTKYFYAAGSSASILAGGYIGSFFVTAPLPGTPKPTRVWVLGDSGTADFNAQTVRNAYYAYTGDRHTDLWLMLGDNAYEQGSDADYQGAVYNMYPTMLNKSVLWPTLGNHDARSASSGTQTGPYYDMFTLPTAGEAGGLASGTEAYYAFDYGNIHFVCLDSSLSDRSTTGPMITWLEADLAATAQDWIVAFWHHPPYSKGSHDSDSEGPLVDMRRAAGPVLEAAGVDLVMSGHSHSYERSYLIDGHYGHSSTLDPTMVLDDGDGRIDGDGAYEKPAGGPAANEGAVYAVAGSSGKISGGGLNHPVMYISLRVLGSMVLDFDGLQLNAAFLDNTGVVRDHFTIRKGSAPQFTRIVGATEGDPAAYIWPKSDAVGLAAFDIQFDQPVTLVDSTVSTTEGESSLSVTGLTHLGNGVHRVELSAAIPLGHWTRIAMTVAGGDGTEAAFDLCVGHLPGDVMPDGQFTMSDFTEFGAQFYADGPRDRIDIDGNGQANLADATILGQLWQGTSGHARWQGVSLPPKP